MTPEALRALFPAVTRASYLNAAAASPLAEPVFRAVSDHYREAMEWGDVGLVSWLKRKADARAKLAKLIGMNAEDVAFTPSTSFAFHLVGRMLQERGVREVLVLEAEFPTTTLPLLHLGMKLRVVRPREDGTYPVEDLADAVKASTGAIAISAVQFASGFRVDLEAVSRLCRSRKLFFVLNAVQALGQLPIDATRLRADFVCGTSHKWLMGGYGVGWLAVRKPLIRSATLPIAGWLSTENPLAMDNLVGAKRRGAAGARSFTAEGAKFRKDASALEPGATSWGPIFGLEAAISLILEVGVERIADHNAALQQRLRERLRSLGFVPNLPDGREHVAGICVVPVEGSPLAAAQALGKAGVVVSPRGVGLRISTHVFNNDVDLDQLFWALEKAGVRPAEPARSRPRRKR